ncbi:MAG: hypothetical protein GY807_07010 [Gammaproteobacteria bacterium]|nr:hypothetical protein [Gammaproteobacteria bacterium]
MRHYLYHALGGFRSLFSHRRIWLKFAMVVLGFLASAEMVGVSSWCRFWVLDVNGYHSLLQFFRSKAWGCDLSIMCHLRDYREPILINFTPELIPPLFGKS